MNGRQSLHIFSRDFIGLPRLCWVCRIRQRLTCGPLGVLPWSCTLDYHCSLGVPNIIRYVGSLRCLGMSPRLISIDGRMPPNWMLDVGKQTGEFFDITDDGTRRKSYRLKTLAQYSLEHSTQEQPSKKYFKGTTLDEIVHSYQWDKGSSSSSSSSKVSDSAGNPPPLMTFC